MTEKRHRGSKHDAKRGEPPEWHSGEPVIRVDYHGNDTGSVYGVRSDGSEELICTLDDAEQIRSFREIWAPALIQPEAN